MRALCLLALVPFSAAAEDFRTPEDYVAVERAVASRLESCLRVSDGFDADRSCAHGAYDHCVDLAPDGQSTAGYALCAGVTRNVLDNALNDVWSQLRLSERPDYFAALQISQRAWLAYRKAESEAAAIRHKGGSMSAYEGGVRYVGMSADRLAELRWLAR
jgi:uncharacterized protein YecT (DUF1311 family)